MHSQEHLKWLEENGLLGIAKNNAHHFRRVLKDCLGATNEKVLIVGDQGFTNRHISALIAAGYYIAALDMGLDANLIIQQVKNAGDKADKNVIAALEELPEGNIVILNLSNKLGSIKDISLSYRNYIKEKNHRFASTLSMGNLTTQYYPYVINSIDVDYKELQEKGDRMKKLMDEANEIRITTDLGTDLTFDVTGMTSISNTADYTMPGSGGNIPAGEVYIPPVGKYGVNGKVVIDASIRHKDGTSLVKDPVTIIVENGDVVGFEGTAEAKILQDTIDWALAKAKFPKNVVKIGELGIGINPRASLVGATIIDEKIHGTAHVAIGSNKWFGGDIRTIIHLDQVFNKPNVFLDGKKLEY